MVLCAFNAPSAAVPHCLRKVLLLMRTLCSFWFVHAALTRNHTALHSGSIYVTVVSVRIVCRGRTLFLAGQEEVRQVSNCGQASLSRPGLPQLWGHQVGSLPQGRQAEVAPLCLTPPELRTAPSPR